MDRPHHGHLGPDLAAPRPSRVGPVQLHRRSLSARRGRGRAVPRLHALFHLLVPGCPPGADHFGLHPGVAGRGGVGRADLDRALGARWPLGLAGWQCLYIFEAIPTVLIGFAVLFYLTDRPAHAGWLTRGRAGLARSAHRRRAPADRGACQVEIWRSFWRPQGAAAVAELYRHRHRQPRHAAVSAADHQGARHQQHAGRLGHDDPLYLRRDRMVFCGWFSDRIGERRWTLFWTCACRRSGW